MGQPPSRIEDLLEHAAFARRLARALVADDARADDVLQQAWVAALEHPPRPGHGLKSWLATVVRNAASKLHREESRRAAREESSAVPERSPSTDEIAAQIAAQRELLDAVARLGEPYRSTVHQRYFEECTPTEIARRGGIPVRTVETRLRRGIEQLRADLDRRFAGGREAWAGALVPLAASGAVIPSGVATVVAAAGGGVVVSLSTKVGIAAAGVVIAVSGWLAMTTLRATNDEQLPSTTEPRAAAAETGRSDSAEVARGVPPREAPVAERKTDRFVVAVVTPEGRGVKGAPVVLFLDDEEQRGTVLGDGVTDDQGEVVLPVVDEDCELAVLPGCAPARRIAVEAGTTALEIALDEGVVFSGWVTVDGERPTEPIVLRLGAGEELYAFVRFPESATRRLNDLVHGLAWGPRATTDEEGGFVFYGLRAATRFSVLFPVPYENAATGQESAIVEEAREGVELALRTNPAFRGRIVDVHGTPLAGWRVVPWAVSESGSGSQPEAITDEAGRFRSWLHNKEFERDHGAALIVYDPAGVPVLRVDVTSSVARGWDFGDVTVDAARRLALDVRDPKGAAVRELVAIVERDVSAWDVLGWNNLFVVDAAHVRSGFGVPEEARAIRVLAPGFATADVPCEIASLPRIVELTPAAQLTLAVHDEDGELLRSSRLEVSAAGGPLAWSRSDLQEAHRKLGGSLVEHGRDEDRGSDSVCFSTFDLPFRLRALRADVPLQLVVRDAVGIDVLRETITLAPGEDRSLERDVQTPARMIRGVVRSIDGTPLADASVSFFLERRNDRVRTQTTRDGTFELRGVRAERGTLVAEREGYSRRSLAGHVVDESAPIVIELSPGWSVDIGLFGGTVPPKPTAIWMERASLRPFPEGSDSKIAGVCFEEQPGPEGWSHTFEGLPNEPMLLRATIEGFTLAIRVGNSGGSMDLNAKVSGPVEIEWSIGAGSESGRTLQAIRAVPLGGHHQARATAPIDAADAARSSGVVRFEKLPLFRYGVAFVWADADGALTEELTATTFDVRDVPMERVVVTR